MWKNLTLERAGSNNRIFTTRAERKSFVPYIFISSLLACAALYYLEQGIEVNYAIKTGVKLLVFLLIPGIYFILSRDKNIYISPMSRLSSKRSLFIGLFSGLIFFAVLIIAYYFLKSFIDFEPILIELETKLNITPLNFIFIGIYITLGNSFLEEFFFRGFVFLGIYRAGKPGRAYLYSSLLFALYHIMIIKNWFTPPLFLLAVFGLFVVGLLFSWMDSKSNSFINSWIAHMLADGSIILIGLKMFGIVNF
jgi:membrane protease YdiL (CAAX protease family)